VLARIIGLDDLPRHARAKLLALGLVPGRFVEVIRHKPVTLVRAEHSELALEDDLADGITVKTEDESTPDE
jgi:Fe2+ transport system protein FeoA